MFALVDVNSFYASCETVFRPDLKGTPVVVLSNNDGCVIARSAEAKKLNISMGEPYFRLKKLSRASGQCVQLKLCLIRRYESPRDEYAGSTGTGSRNLFH